MTITKRCSGYSILEMLIALAILLTLLALSVPSMADFLVSMRLRAGADALVTALNMSRAAAVQQSARVVLCKSSDGLSCSDTSDWGQGWLVFYDYNNSATREEHETVIYQQAAPSGRLVMRGNSPVSNYVSYMPLGQATLVNGNFQAGTITVCSGGIRQVMGYQVFIAASGRARLATATQAQCTLANG